MIGLILLVLAGAAAAIAAVVDPTLDLGVAGYLLSPAVKAALAPWYPWLEVLRTCNLVLTYGLLLIAIGTLVARLLTPRRLTLMPARAALLIIATYALAPGLLVNGVLKSHWGRPRPAAVVELGGTQPFVQWWDWRGQCASNCSFVSGEASAAYALMAPAAVMPAPWRTVAIGAAVAYGTGIGLMRMATGSHFLTDVIFAGVFTGLLVWLLYGVMYRWKRTRLTEERVERFLDRGRARIGERLHRLRGAPALPKR